VIRYGRAPGQYTQQTQDALYVKAHTIIVQGLLPGTTYYLAITSADQSGNTTESSGYSFTTARGAFVRLPLILRAAQ
jgi:hypothetical protein